MVMNKKIFKKFLATSVLIGGLNFSLTQVNFEVEKLQVVSVAHAEIKTIIGDDVAMFDFGEDDTKIVNTVKNVAKMRAIQVAKEKAGVYVKSYTTTSNGVLTRDDISAVTNNISEILDVKYERSIFQPVDASGNSYGNVGIMYTATVTVNINTDGIYDYLKKSSEEKANIIQQDKNLQNSVLETVGNFEDVRANAKNQNMNQVHEDLNKIDKEISAEEKLIEGNKCAYQKNYQGAILKYNEAIRINPNTNYAQNNLESIYSDRKNIEQIIEDLDKTIKLNPRSSEAYYKRGVAYYYVGETYSHSVLGYKYFNPQNYKQDKKYYKKAIKDYNKVIQINPNFTEVYNKRGRYYLNLRKYKQAIKDLEKAIQLNPNFAEAYNNCGKAYYWLANYKQENYKKVITYYDKAIQLNPNFAEAYYNRGKAYIWLRNYEQVIKDYDIAIELDPNNAHYYEERGDAYHRYFKNYEQAVEDYKKCIELKPNESLFYSNIIYIYKEWGKNKEAQEYEAKAREIGLSM